MCGVWCVCVFVCGVWCVVCVCVVCVVCVWCVSHERSKRSAHHGVEQDLEEDAGVPEADDGEQMHPLQLMMEKDTAMGRKLKYQEELRAGNNADEDPGSAADTQTATAASNRGRIFFLDKFGPETAIKHYREWLRSTAQTIRDKLYGGYSMSRHEWEEDRRYRTRQAVLYTKGADHDHVLDGFRDLNDPAEYDRIRWDDLFGDAGAGVGCACV